MRRFTVHIVSPATATTRPVLLVPFEPSALVVGFIEELFKRLARQSIPLTADTHVCTLHLDSETGAVVDCEDLIGDVIFPDDVLFAVYSPASTTEQAMTGSTLAIRNGAGEILSVRIITAVLANKDKSTLKVLKIPASSTVQQLHEQVADHLGLPHTFTTIENECNCNLAKQLSDGPSSPTSFIVVQGKSNIQRISLPASTEVEINVALKAKFGATVSEAKHITFHGAEISQSAFNLSYAKTPVVSICAKHRHIPRHAKVGQEDGSEQHTRVLDLHTSECPINRTEVTLHETGVAALALDGVIDIYAVSRAITNDSDHGHGVGKSVIFRYRSHWEPPVKQSDRGIAMLLSSLRVFASNVQEMEDHRKDAIYHVFDLLSNFPPALRSLHLLIEGKTITPMESSALSHALFDILQRHIPTEMIGTDGSRLFEGGRLLFGFMLEKARVLKLAQAVGDGDDVAVENMPYLSAFSAVDVQDFKTTEAIIHAVRTEAGIMERSLYQAFDKDGVLSDSHLKPDQLILIECPSNLSRVALLGGGTTAELMVFSASTLASNYRYPDGGKVASAFDSNELSELEHIAAVCGRNGLAVHKPSQLASAVAPCLTFDRNALLAVYNGPQASSQPGDESGIFRPKHGNEAMDATVVEQLIAPILSRYEADGTSVFDMLGGSTVRRLQAPDEIVMFAVDCSSSMRSKTDFPDVSEDDHIDEADPTAETLVEGKFFARCNFDEVKELLSKHESFQDMLAIVVDSPIVRRRNIAAEILGLVRMELSHKIVASHAKIERSQGLPGYARRIAVNAAETALIKTKEFWAALQTHETSLIDFLLFRATTSEDVSSRWLWYAGQEIPVGAPAGIIPSLPSHITDVPDGLQCPISYSLMEDAVVAPDGFTYSRSAITQWFAIRKSSPMTGLELGDTTLRSNDAVTASVAMWISGNDTLSRPRHSLNSLKLMFNSRLGQFERYVDPQATVSSLYKTVFSGLKARFTAFQLAKDDHVLSNSGGLSLHAAGLKNGDQITIRLADDEDIVVSGSGTSTSRASGEMCLVKVYDRGVRDHAMFSFWVRRDTSMTLNSVLFKFWRFKFSSGGISGARERQIWTDMSSSGDGFCHGSPQNSNDRLALYLNRSHCSGRLEAEPLFATDETEQDLGAVRSTDAPLVLKVSVSDVWSKKRGRSYGSLSRLDVLKQMFEALINRMIAYNFKTHVGLVTFASAATVTNSISHVLENFRRATSAMNAKGDTALWDALSLSLDQIKEMAMKYPDAKKRIIVISDGVDTKSATNTCEDIAWKMKEAGVAVDTISLGDEIDRDLKTLSWLLGCYSFHPTSLANALAICEMEPFLSATERPDIVIRSKATNRLAFRSSYLNARFSSRDTVVTGDRFPDRKEHESLTDEFVQLSTNLCRSAATTGASGARSTFHIARIMKEINQLAAKDHPQYDVYVSERNMAFWKVVLSGPSDSPYEAGTFLLYLDMRANYPTFHPEARFITKIVHPNVNAHGRVCHPLFGRDWTTDTNMTTVLDTIYGLLFQAEVSDPVSTLSTLEYHADGVEFAEAVRDHVQRHALKSRLEWQKEFVGGADDDEDGEEDDSDELSEENYDEDENQDAGDGSEIEDLDEEMTGEEDEDMVDGSQGGMDV